MPERTRELVLTKERFIERVATIIGLDEPEGLRLTDTFYGEQLSIILGWDEVKKLIPWLEFWFKKGGKDN